MDNTKNIMVSFFKNYATPTRNEDFELVIQDITKGRYKEQIEQLRDAFKKGDKKTASFIKKNLAAFTPAGIYKDGRKSNLLYEYSYTIHLDIDKVTEDTLKTIIEKLQQCSYTYAYFISPSGKGIKVFIKVDSGYEYHTHAYLQVQHYFENLLGVKADPSCKDITRLCYVSYDSNAYINNNCKTYIVSKTNNNQQTVQKESKRKDSETLKNTDSFIENFDKSVALTEKNISYQEGSRNRFIFNLACNCNRFGIMQGEAQEKICSEYDLGYSEILQTIESAYKNNIQEFGQFHKSPNNEQINDVDYLKNTDKFDSKLFDKLPVLLKNGTKVFADKRERDVFLLGAISVLSGCLPNVEGVYDGQNVFPNLIAFIVAPAASGKGVLKFAKKLAEPYQKQILDLSEKNKKTFDVEMNQYQAALRSLKKKETLKVEKPDTPPFKVLFIPANSSYAKVVYHLQQNEGVGIIFETEADSMGMVFKQDWGGYSDMLRKVFHHETVSISRKKDNEYIIIEEPKLSVVLSGTPGQVANIISSSEDGLFSRFVFYSFKVEQEWKDVSPRGKNVNLNNHFNDLSNTVLDLITFLEQNPSEFKLTEKQWNLLNNTGNRWIKDILIFNAEDQGSVVKRLGLILFRIAMIFTALRKFENGDCSKTIVCSDDDFYSAISISQTLLQHSKLMYANLPKKVDETVFSKGDNKRRFYEKLPNKFKRGEAIRLGINFGLETRSVDAFLKKLLKTHLIQPSFGVYQKLEQSA
jgi:hypothetical protein